MAAVWDDVVHLFSPHGGREAKPIDVSGKERQVINQEYGKRRGG